MKRFLSLFLLASSFQLLVFSPAFAQVATPGPVILTFAANPSQTVEVDQIFDVEISLNSSADEINALQGTVAFPQDALEIKEIRDGNSSINFWIERPHLEDAGIAFAGMIPGGTSDAIVRVFTVRFIAKKAGSAVVNVTGVIALRNDGKGTAAELKTTPIRLTIGPATGNPPPAPSIVDTEPPEGFRPEIAQDPNAFDGKWFVAFSTQDKKSGIDHYEVKEEIEPGTGVWRIETSPYVLQDQARTSVVYVKAVDGAGNTRTESIAPPAVPGKLPDWRVLVGVGVVGILLAGFLLTRRRRRT